MSATEHNPELSLSGAHAAPEGISAEATGGAHASSGHSSLHTPPLQGQGLFGTEWLTQTVLSTWAYMAVLALGLAALRVALARKKPNLLKSAGLAAAKAMDSFLTESLGEKEFARRAAWLLGGCFAYVITSNLFGLGVDWFGTFLPAAHSWLRPANSDLNTTLGMAAVVLASSHVVMLRTRGFFGWVGHYLFNFHGSGIVEKCIGVMVGWLHLVGEAVRLTSLSMRLFGNIFAGTMLLVIMVFLSAKIEAWHLNVGEMLTLPFWLLELFVAYVQALVFTTLACVYLREAREAHH